jgi:hypothetical protein
MPVSLLHCRQNGRIARLSEAAFDPLSRDGSKNPAGSRSQRGYYPPFPAFCPSVLLLFPAECPRSGNVRRRSGQGLAEWVGTSYTSTQARMGRGTERHRSGSTVRRTATIPDGSRTDRQDRRLSRAEAIAAWGQEQVAPTRTGSRAVTPQWQSARLDPPFPQPLLDPFTAASTVRRDPRHGVGWFGSGRSAAPFLGPGGQLLGQRYSQVPRFV